MPRTAAAPTMSFVVETSVPLMDHIGVELARRRQVARRELVSENRSVDYALLARARGQNEPAARQWVRRLREAGKLITVDYNGTLIPSFQFDRDYELIPEVSRAVTTLTDAGMSGWAVWRWFCVVSPWIDDKPVHLIETGQLDELEALAVQFVEDSRQG